MKKTAVLVVAAMLVVASLVGGVFALYESDLDTMESGNVAAKDFILTGAGDENFALNAQIAPTEKIEKKFTVKNFDAAGNRSETDMDVTVTVTLATDIAPLTITLYDGSTAVGTKEGNVITYKFGFTANVNEEKAFTVELSWPDTANDVDYKDGAAKFTVDVHAVQRVAA